MIWITQDGADVEIGRRLLRLGPDALRLVAGADGDVQSTTSTRTDTAASLLVVDIQMSAWMGPLK